MGLLKNFYIKCKVKWLTDRWNKLTVGSPEWLIACEGRYGGFVSNVKRIKTSKCDPRSKRDLETGGMTGGDRMIHHGYAEKYSEHLFARMRKSEVKCVSEFGILRGSGLAIWCDLFPDARVLGFDIDLSHTIGNLKNLSQLGAFARNKPELYEYDQFVCGKDVLDSVLKGSTIDVCIDDGFHSHETILTTMRSVIPFMSPQFVYFVEDNDTVAQEIMGMFPDLRVECCGRLTVVSRGM